MNRVFSLIVFATIVLTGCSMQSAMLMRPVDAQLTFISPKNQARVESPVMIQVQMDGMPQALVNKKGQAMTAIYLMVNQSMPALNQSLPINEDGVYVIKPNLKSTELVLTPGQHRLQMIAVDQWYRPHIPPLISEIITINVSQ